MFDFLKAESVDIAFVCETFLNDSFLLSVFNDDDFHAIRCDRIPINKSHGGGVLILIRKSLKYVEVNVKLDEFYTSHFCELSCIDIFANDCRYRTILAYRPPSTNLDQTRSLMSHLNSLLLPSNNIIIGDFNVPKVNWNLNTSPRDSVQRCVHDFSITNSFKQLVTFPTHTGNSQNTLDIILTDSIDLISNVHQMPPLCNSDHNTVSFDINITTSPCNHSQRKKTRDYKNCDIDNVKNELLAINWDHEFSFYGTVQNKYDFFLDNLIKIINDHTPFKPSINKPNYPKTIQNLYKEKLALYRSRHTSTDSKTRYKVVCKQLKIELTRHFSKKEDKLITDGSRGSFYSYLRRNMKSVHGIPTILDSESEPVFDDNNKAMVFTELFNDVYESDQTTTPSFLMVNTPTTCHLDFSPFLVFSYLNKLPNKFTTTSEQINQFMLKSLATELALPLSILFNEIYLTCQLPNQWKTALVVPVYKKGVRNDRNNYRPISITSSICRLMERIIAQKIRFTYSTLLTPHQYGFIPKKSCNLALLSCIETWQTWLKQKKNVDVIYFDFSKCFDKVSHPKLLYKLDKLGFDQKLIKWFSNFISNRTSHVRINDFICTEPIRVTSGVLQGTVTGPLLFLFYVNDLALELEKLHGIKFAFYADDLKIFGTCPNSIQKAIDIVNKWSNEWRLPLALNKINVLHIGNHNPNHNYSISGVPIEAKPIIRDLGVYIDNKLTFESHINRKVATAFALCKHILRSFTFKDPLKYMSLFTMYVSPHLEYCAEIFNPRPNSKLTKSLEGPLRYFTASVLQRLGISYTSYINRLEILNQKPLYIRRLNIDLIQVYKLLHGLSVFDRSIFKLSRSPRCPLRVIVNRAIYADDNFFFQRVLANWNKIAPRLSHCNSLPSFKQLLNELHIDFFIVIPNSCR
jgi:hypothetical protein